MSRSSGQKTDKTTEKAGKAAKCIAFATHKGGTGKTSSCVSIAGHLADNGYRVLVVDFDPGANATSALGIDAATVERSIYDAILGECDSYERVPLTEVILETSVENLHVAPSELDLAAAEALMLHARRRPYALNRILGEVRPLYDYILIDLPPNPGLLTINGLCAADQVVVPMDPSIFSLEALENMRLILDDVRRIAGHSISEVTVVLNRYVKRSIVSRLLSRRSPSQEIEATLTQMFDSVFVVPESTDIFETQRQGVPISHHAPQSRVGRAYAEIANSISANSEQKSHSSRQTE